MLRIIKEKIRHWKNSRELRKSNYGRDFGWYIEFEENIIGELVYYKFSEMFWDSYRIVSINEKWNHYLFNEEHWFTDAFKFKNKHYNLYAINAIARKKRDLVSSKRLEMRSLYLKKL